MGYGGDLIWTRVIAEIARAVGRPVLLAKMPLLTDLMLGYEYDRSGSYAGNPMFLNNPHIRHVQTVSKIPFSKLIDRAFLGFLRAFHLIDFYERFLFWRAERLNRLSGASYLVFLNLRMLSYAARELPDRFVWKSGGHAAQAIGQDFGLSFDATTPELFMAEDEREKIAALVRKNNLDQPFIFIEPGTNTDWFGTLRAWPIERWQEVIDRIREKYPDLRILQIGMKTTSLLRYVEDFREQTTFRELAFLLPHARLILATEGGVMHAAAAVRARALIIWGGVTAPEFAGYPDSQETVCTRVACMPCGFKGNCPNGHICMDRITVDDVWNRVQLILQ